MPVARQGKRKRAKKITESEVCRPTAGCLCRLSIVALVLVFPFEYVSKRRRRTKIANSWGRDRSGTCFGSRGYVLVGYTCGLGFVNAEKIEEIWPGCTCEEKASIRGIFEMVANGAWPVCSRASKDTETWRYRFGAANYVYS